MPVSKISDAPANIQTLDDVDLTLAQINYILNIYDALKEEGEVDSPMAVAIEQFKEAYHKAGGKWVRNEKAASAISAGTCDLDNLDKYIVLPTGSEALTGIDDLRELEGDFGRGVYALWSDVRQSIVAFVFEPAFYTEDEAQGWVRKAMEKKPAELSLVDVVQAVFAPVARALERLGGRGNGQQPIAARSFDEIRRLVSQALDDAHAWPSPVGDTASLSPWIVGIGTSSAIVEIDSQRYAVPYSIDANDTVTLGELAPVDEQWVRKADGAPVFLHSFAVHLGAGDEAEDDEDDGLIWKELIHPGEWFKSDTGRKVQVTAEIIKGVFAAWKAGLPKLISVPSDTHHNQSDGIVPVESNRGFVEELKLIGDKLFGGFKLTDPEVGYGVQVGNIADCSVYLQPEAIHPTTGKKFPWSLRHVLLTNAPLAQDLAPFGAIPASRTDRGVIVQSYRQVSEEVNEMSKQDTEQSQGLTLSAEDAATFEEFKGLGLSTTEITALVTERDAVRQKARGLEITQIVRALEGSEQHGSVTQVENTRHWPVVCVAVEKALREQPQALAMSADDDGKTGLDVVVLDVVNALPADARMALQAQPAGDKEPKDPSLAPDDGEPTDDQIEELESRLR